MRWRAPPRWPRPSARCRSLPNQRLYRDFLSAGATLVEDRARGEAALRRVIDAANANRTATYARLVRASLFDVLVESAAQSGNAAAVLGLLTERLGAPRLDRCVLGIASWNHLVVAALDGEGRPDPETRDVPEGMVMGPGDLIPRSRCARRSPRPSRSPMQAPTRCFEH